MRTLLRRIPTGEYYQTLNQWTRNAADAYDFRAVELALQFVQLTRLGQTEVVLGSGDGQVTAIPVTKFRNGFPVRGAV